CRTADNPRQRIRSLDTRTERDGLEERLRCGAERRNRRLSERVSKAETLEGVPLERVTHREIQACRGLVVVLRERLLCRGQVDRLPGRSLIVLGSVEVLLVIENLEA